MKTIVRSKTTATIAGSTAGVGGLVTATLTFLRSQGVIPWEVGGDTFVLWFVTACLVPLVTRGIAAFRNK